MSEIVSENLPRHVAVIMDGNGRWAKERGLARVMGHEKGAEAVRSVVRANRELGIPWLTLYSFSEENWKRPQHEIQALMELLKRFLRSELAEMRENGIRLQAVGRLTKLPDDTRKVLSETMEETSSQKDMVLTLALSYGGRQELCDAFNKLAKDIPKGQSGSHPITENDISAVLYTSGMPDPDFLIRTSGEFRISNFLLWQMAYTEIYITQTLWPDFGREEYRDAIRDYQRRERRFGTAGD